MGKNISNKEIQLTIQGQTVSSNFGTVDAAQFNIEQLLHAGITNDLFLLKRLHFRKTRRIFCKSCRQQVLKLTKGLGIIRTSQIIYYR